MGTGSSSPVVKRPGREADHSPPLSDEVKNAWSYTSTPKYVFMAWCFVKPRGNFTFITGSAILNVSQYYHYSKEDEQQVVSNERRLVVFTSTTFFSAVNITLEVN
jgi:hypothetical protein